MELTKTYGGINIDFNIAIESNYIIMPTRKKSSSSQKASVHKGAEKRKEELPAKRKRQYKHILDTEKKEGRSTKSAKRIAMATVNKTRTKKGEAKSK